MRDLLILLVHLIATLARLLGPGGLWSASVTSTSRMTNRSVDVQGSGDAKRILDRLESTGLRSTSITTEQGSGPTAHLTPAIGVVFLMIPDYAT